MSIECTGYKEINKGTLLGYADIFVTKWGIEIRGCSHHKKGNQEWVSLPSREYTKPDGQKAYAPIVQFKEKNHAGAFGDACKKAIHNRPKSQEQSLQSLGEFPF
jgi:hypothetical protein